MTRYPHTGHGRGTPNLRPAWRRAMTANTWAALASTSTIAAVNPENDASINPNGAGVSAPWHGIDGQGAIIVAWGGATYGDATHSMHIDAAGGHGDYAGNESYKINLAADAPAWVMTRKPTGAIGNIGTLDDTLEASGVYFDGRPRSSHTYNYPIYVPGVGPVQPRQVANYRTAGDALKAFKYDPATGAPSLIINYTGTANVLAAADPVGASCYDPTRSCVWTVYGGTTQIQKLDPVGATITLYGAWQTWAGGIVSVNYLPEVDALLVISSLDVCLINLTTFAKTVLTFTGSFSTGLGVQIFNGTSFVYQAGTLSSSQAVVGAQWDTVRHRLVLWSNNSTLAQISTLTPGANYFTDAWTRGALTVDARNTVNPASVGPTGNNGIYGRFALSASYDGVFLVTGVADPVNFYAFS